MALITTVGGSTSNSYATVSEYRQYWLGQLFPSDQATPDSFGDDEVEWALKEACLVLDAQSYFGGIVTQTQALKWPRARVTDDEGRAVSQSAIPQAVKDAQCELAYTLLVDSEAFAGDPFAGFSEINLGNSEVDVKLRGGAATGSLPAKVVRLLRNLRSSSQARILRA